MTLKSFFPLFTLIVLGAEHSRAQDDPEPIPIATTSREQPVDFAKEIYPLLKKNCIACHNSSKAKAQLNLESPKSILKGGSDGPAIVPGKPEESFLLQVASHREDPIMPPEDNKSNAVPFTPEELGLIQQWIAEGAKGKAVIATPTPTHWILANRQDYPVYHMALGPDDRFVAASRGQRVFLYDFRQGKALGELIDPQLAEQEVFRTQTPAHQDFVQSIAFSRDGWIATGGFRNAKLWKPARDEGAVIRSLSEVATAMATTPDGAWAAVGDAGGNVSVWKTNDGTNTLLQEKWHEGEVTGLSFSADGQRLATSGVDGKVHLVQLGPEGAGQIARSHSGDHPWQSVLLLSELGRLLAGSETGEIVQWLLAETGEALPTLAAHEKPVSALAAYPQADQLVSASVDGKAIWWNVSENTVIRSVDHGEALVDVACAPGGEVLVTLGEASAKVWKFEDGTHLRDLEVTPEAVEEEERLKRRRAIAQVLVDNRKKKLGEREKAWKGEVEKAKKAAADQLAALTKRDEADRADHAVRLRLVDSQKRVEEARRRSENQVAGFEQTVASGEEDLKAQGRRLDEERQKTEGRVAELETKLAEAQAVRQTSQETLKNRRAERERRVKVKDQAEAALGALRQVGEILHEESSDAVKLIADIEALLSDAEQKFTVIDAGVGEAERADRVAAKALADLQKYHEEITRTTRQLESELESTKKRIETAKAGIVQAEAASKQLAEGHQKVEEEAKKASDALEAANKAHAQAAENEELALRLSQRASEAQTRALTALTIAEAQLADREKALEGATKVDPPGLTQVAFDPTGKRFALGRRQGGLLLYDSAGERLLETAAGPPALGVAALSETRWLTGTPAKELREWIPGVAWKWERTVGAIDDPEALIDRVTAVAFSPNGTLLATGSGSPSRSGQLKIWRVADGSLLMEMEDAHSDTIVGLEFSPDGQHVATASTDRFAKVFSLRDGTLVTAFEGHTGHVLDVSWRADGLVLATAGADNVIKLWDFEEQRQIKTVNGYNQEITSVAFADTAEKLVTSSGDKSVRLGGDRLDGKEFVYASALSRDGQWLLAAAQDSVVRVWQTKDKKLVQEFAAPSE